MIKSILLEYASECLPNWLAYNAFIEMKLPLSAVVGEYVTNTCEMNFT